MPILTTKCGHCGTFPTPLQVHGAFQIEEEGVAVLGKCPRCKLPTAVIINKQSFENETAEWFFSKNATGNVDWITESGWKIYAQYPETIDEAAPEHTPKDVARIFLQAKGAHRRGDMDAAAILYRKVLEVSSKQLLPTSNKPLMQRIDELATSRLIPDAVKDWAHEIRVEGNLAAHDAAEPSPEDVAEIADFTEAFLEYVYTMAEKLMRRKSRKFAPPSAKP